jgi:beta-lactamase superfamily II metal-dependent hydrolase
MHLTAFQSGKGDCLLLSNEKSTVRILVDGGMPAAYATHVAPALAELRAAKQDLDLVYVSHIDQDHIGGVLRMLNDEVEWRVHEHQKSNGNPGHKPPKAPRPPKIHQIWHNAFHEQITKNAGEIEDALAAIAPVLAGADVATLREIGLQQSDLATSINEAIQVSRRIGPNQLKIDLNKPAGGKLMMLRGDQQSITLAPRKAAGAAAGEALRVTIVGPTGVHLKELRVKWNDWLRKNQETLKTIRQKARQDVERLGTSEFDRFLTMLRLQTESFGNPDSVTAPNVASLTLLVEEKGAESVLLTGDARGDHILEGIEAAGRLVNGGLNVDVLKVQHHGSENNIDSVFCDAVVARDYVFCGNGEHENPDERVVDLIARRRLMKPGKFTFWFNSSSLVSDKDEARKHMAIVEKTVEDLAKGAKGRMAFRFLEKGSKLQVM